MLKAVIFDMDGVLLDSESVHFRVIRGMMEERGHTYTRAYFNSTCGMLEEEMWPQLLRDADVGPEDPMRMQEEHQARFRAYIQEHGLPEFPGLREFLARLQQGELRLAVASASPKEQIEANLRALKCEPYFSCVVSARECARCKPEPDVFLLAAKKLGVPPEDCMVIEDSANGMRAACRAGMKWVGFCGAEVEPDMRLAPFSFGDYRTAGIEQLQHWYQKLEAVHIRIE